jgi:hypothetical protein
MTPPGASFPRALLVACALLGPSAHSEGQGVEELRQRYAGDYRFAGGEAERSAVPAAVERSVDGMFFIARGIAYDRLLHVCEICERYTLSFSNGEVEVRGPCQLPDRGPDDGREVDHLTKAKDASKLSQRFVDGALVQDFTGEGGSRRVVWTLSPDGDGLLVHITIESHHLPHPVDYALHYQRVPKPAPSAPPVDAGLP